ncbi:MAG: ABC transporter permease [Planctomycetes bacterium]|jgi:ABC-type transport system involved in multi-copper enzyme maturation permease subunit|nr:ABC transporter permease [Planctomycetota bacterium]
MRTFYAILKDSFREAVDAKLFYVLSAFSLLLSVFCLGIGFRTRSFDEALRRIFHEGQWDQAAVPMPEKGAASFGAPPRVLRPSVESVEEADGRFRAVLRLENVEEFRAHVFRFDSDPMAAAGGETEKDVVLLEGRKGFETYLRRRLLQGGFVPSAVEKPDEATWAVSCKPLGGLKTEGAQSMTLFFGLTEFPLRGLSGRNMILTIQNVLANAIGGWIGVLIAVVVTAWFIPNLLRKGSVDLLLARPVARWRILVYRYLGGLTFVFLNAAVLVGGTWAGITIGTGFVQWGYLLCVVTITLLFAILYSVSCLVGVLFRNVVLCILFPVAFWFFCYLITTGKRVLDSPQINAMWSIPPFVKTGATVLHYVFPSTTNIGSLNTWFMLLGETDQGQIALAKATLGKIDFAGSVASSLVFTAVVVALAAWLFHRKDY